MFKNVDVITVAKALVKDGVSYECNDSYYGYTCHYCYGELTPSIEDFKHKLGCPVLIAKELLTGEKDV